jgi:hypothetical protein
MSADASNTQLSSALVNTQLALQITEETHPTQKALFEAAFISPDLIILGT